MLTLKALVALLMLSLGLGGAVWSWNKGKTSGKQEVQQLWDKAANDAREETTRVREEGFKRAGVFEAALKESEARYERTNASLRTTLRRPAAVVCPATGGPSYIGDIILPADLIDSMFNREPDAGSGAPGSAASQPPR